MTEIDRALAKGPRPWDDRLVGEEHLRRLAAIRDEARNRWDDLMYWLHKVDHPALDLPVHPPPGVDE